MAWIRWRGQSAQLLATVWENGKTRQRYLASLGGVYTVPEWVQAQITSRFPTIPIDWPAIQATLVQGPPGVPPPSAAMLDWAAVESRLREWAQTGPEDYPGERHALRAAAHILETWRAREAQAQVAQQLREAARSAD